MKHIKSHNTSDHLSLWIIPDGIDTPPPQRPFCFEEVWLSDDGCSATVEAVWRVKETPEPEHMVLKKGGQVCKGINEMEEEELWEY